MPKNDPEYERGFTDGFNAGTRFQAERTPPSDAEQLSELRRVVKSVLENLESDHVGPNLFRLGLIGKQDVESAIELLKEVLTPQKEKVRE